MIEILALDRQSVIDVLRQELHTLNDEIALDLPSNELLRDELGIDSLDLVELVARVEYRFGFIVSDEDWQRFETLEDIAAYVVDHAIQ